MEGWLEKQKILVQQAGKGTSEKSSKPESSNQEEEEMRLQEEAEQSLAEQDIKRKAGVQDVRKSKKRKLEKVIG